MAQLLRLKLYFRWPSNSSIIRNSSSIASLTHQEVAAALRPFYFAVHPDLFWQHPKEKEINENSLKVLNSYLESLLKNQPASPTSVTFCLRSTKLDVNDDITFKKVSIKLLGRDLRNSVHSILSTCQLSTQYLDAITVTKPAQESAGNKIDAKQNVAYNAETVWWKESQQTAYEIEQRIRNEPEIDFRVWLSQNIVEAQHRLQASQALREETVRLCDELKETLSLEDIIWNCGWGITHFRGCLLSFRGLAMQHTADMSVLKSRTVIFGQQTGVSFEGHIILSSEDVRTNWLDMINSISQFDSLLQQIPNTEKSLSDVLRGITVDHRKFQPTVMVQKYIQQLEKLTSALYKYKWQNGYPSAWPPRLEKFQIVVECEAGPLMLSPTGQFIVPASCPAFLLVDFISKNLSKASQLLEEYAMMKSKESEVYDQCMTTLGLSALEKDDNVTPDLMIKCCERLVEQASIFSRCLRDLRLRISHYYSVLQDGDICIPWDWKQLPSR